MTLQAVGSGLWVLSDSLVRRVLAKPARAGPYIQASALQGRL